MSRWRLRHGLALGAGLWAASACALTLFMQSGLEAAAAARRYGLLGAPQASGTMPPLAVLWAVVFVVLQAVVVPAMAAGVRAGSRMTAPASFALSGAALLLADTLGLFAMLVWLRVNVGTG